MAGGDRHAHGLDHPCAEVAVGLWMPRHTRRFRRERGVLAKQRLDTRDVVGRIEMHVDGPAGRQRGLDRVEQQRRAKGGGRRLGQAGGQAGLPRHERTARQHQQRPDARQTRAGRPAPALTPAAPPARRPAPRRAASTPPSTRAPPSSTPTIDEVVDRVGRVELDLPEVVQRAADRREVDETVQQVPVAAAEPPDPAGGRGERQRNHQHEGGEPRRDVGPLHHVLPHAVEGQRVVEHEVGHEVQRAVEEGEQAERPPEAARAG